MNTLRINLAQVTANTVFAKQVAERAGFALVGVLKAVQCQPKLIEAIQAAGVDQFAFSSSASVAALKPASLPKREARLLLGPSAPDGAAQIVRLFGASIQSSHAMITSLGSAARSLGQGHEVLLALRTGDAREGLDLSDQPAIEAFVETVKSSGLGFAGLACNLGCTQLEKMGQTYLSRLLALRGALSQAHNQVVALSLGGSFILPDLPDVAGPRSVRVGELLLSGTEPAGRPLAGCTTAFSIEATIVEVTPTQNYSHILLDIGSAVLEPGAFTFERAGSELVSMSGEFMVLEVNWEVRPHLGDKVRIHLGYDSLKRALSFPFLTWEWV